ncbi:MAG: FxsA family protein [Nocardioidaceae bacterium]
MPFIGLLIAFIVMPILEIFVIIQVGQQVGAWPTIALLVFESLLGGWLVKREGKRAWEALDTTVRRGQLPGKQLVDAALILVGGTLLLTPGFITDVLGFFLILPFTRPLARRLVTAYAARRVARGQRNGSGPGRGGVYRIYRDNGPKGL